MTVTSSGIEVDVTTDPVSLTPSAVAPGADHLVAEVLASGRIASGPKVEAFERACATMAGTAHAVAVTNGTVSLELLLDALGIGPGDEVIAPAFTFAATASAIVRRGATARLVDVGPDRTIDLAATHAALSPKTAAIIAVHLYGLPADVHGLAALAERAGVPLIEDAAQAHGATVAGAPVGGFGHGSFSFYATKNVSCGEGGAVTTNDAALADRLRLLRNQGMRARHHHEVVGTNHRLSELHAALGLASMAQLETTTQRRRRHADALCRGLRDLPGIELPTEPAARRSAWHQFTITHPERDRLTAELQMRGVESAVHYPLPVHHQRAFLDHPQVHADDCPRSEQLAGTCLSLPVHQELGSDDLARIIDAVREALEVSCR